ncbi:MAG: M64 family metallopeptidase [Pseudomonadota bacterium]
MTNLIVFPHCDVHLVRDDPNLSSISFSVFRQSEQNGADDMDMENITPTCRFHTFSPYNTVGNRADSGITVTPPTQDQIDIGILSGTISVDPASTTPITFIVVEDNFLYIVIRVQVHQSLAGWWFGNSSLTTAVDDFFGHCQPSIYAQFSDDGNGTDLVGDITGHGFVELQSADPTTCEIDNRENRGRLLGVTEGTTTISGALDGDAGGNAPLPVRVVDYGQTRAILDTVRPGAQDPPDAHNILFLAEGFRDTPQDRATFDDIVNRTQTALFREARHQPFPALAGSFQVYSAFEPSEQDLMTIGYKVKDNDDGPQRQGTRLPSNDQVGSSVTNFTVDQLVRIVGLPQRGESRNRNQLLDLWESQSLPIANFGAFRSRTSLALINAWKGSTAIGFLEARDTFFGFMVGRRYADQQARRIQDLTGSAPPLLPPPDAGLGPDVTDAPNDNRLPVLINATYTWFRNFSTLRTANLDTRRHPPELFKNNAESRDTAIMRYIGRLQPQSSPGVEVGLEWVPDPLTFKRSRGLIAVILKDGVHAGTNLNALTITAQSIESATILGFEYPNSNPPNKKIMRRTPPNPPEPIFLSIQNTVAHEFGHSFNLGDEYEQNEGDAPDSTERYDNITTFSTIDLASQSGRSIDVSAVKWADLPRMALSSRTITAGLSMGSSITVNVGPEAAARWEVAKQSTTPAGLRAWKVSPSGRQLEDVEEHLGLTIGTIDKTAGLVELTGLSSAVPTVFSAGSVVFTELRDGTTPLKVIEPQVRQFLTSDPLPLNRDDDIERVKAGPDHPRRIPGFKPPCDSSRLVGVFEGAEAGTGMVYRPAGDCKMRNSGRSGFCHVCKWLITNRVDPSYHAHIDREFYPTAKKNG